MMMMNKLTLMWHVVLRPQGHITVKKSHVVVNAEMIACQNSCKTEQKARFSVDCEKLVVIAMPELTPADCSEQKRQLPVRHGRRR